MGLQQTNSIGTKEINMRRFRGFSEVILMAAASMVAPSASAQELMQGEKPMPAVKDVADVLGQPLASVFTKFGAPSDVFVTGAKSKNPGVVVDYGKFGFEIHDKKVTECDFWSDWTTPVMGAKIGDMADDIVKEMGQPAEDIKNADGTEVMVWHGSDKKTKISIAYNKKRKSTGLMLEPE
jgi:hypothetical protein